MGNLDEIREMATEAADPFAFPADLSVVQTSGPPWPWRITDGVLHQEAGDAR